MRGMGTWRGTWMLQRLILTGLATLHGQPAQAQAGGSIYEPIWRLGEWYRDDTNPVVQSVLFKGRFQQDYAVVNGDQGSEREWNVRRLRLGVRAGVLQQLTVHAEVDLISRLWGRFYINNKLKVVVIRLNRFGKMQNSKPCSRSSNIFSHPFGYKQAKPNSFCSP